MTAKKRPKVSFEEGMSELNRLVERMQSGELALGDMMSTYEQGMALCDQLDALLTAHERKLEQIDPETAEITTCEGNENGVQ